MNFAQTGMTSSTAILLLAAVATVGYVLGRRRPEGSKAQSNSKHEILRALAVAQELEAIAYRLRKSLTFHVPAIVKFKARLKRWERTPEVSWHDLCDRADELLKPALRLSTEVSHAYADLLQQMTQLSAFAELRTDPLTGICNRRAFDDSLERLVASQSETDEAPLVLVMLDLDHFKQINDEQGHLGGDRVLQDFSQLIKTVIRENDVLARYGGEEFVVLLPRTAIGPACNLAERMRARIEQKLATTVSIGIAALMPQETCTSLIARADTAMYTAKRQGRNCVSLHEGESGRVVTIRAAEPGKDSNAPKSGGSQTDSGLRVAFPLVEMPAVSIYRGEAC